MRVRVSPPSSFDVNFFGYRKISKVGKRCRKSSTKYHTPTKSNIYDKLYIDANVLQHCRVGERFESELKDSRIPGIQYQLLVFPNGENVRTAGQIIATLHFHNCYKKPVVIDASFANVHGSFPSDVVAYTDLINPVNGYLACGGVTFTAAGNFDIQSSWLMYKHRTKGDDKIADMLYHHYPNLEKFTLKVGENEIETYKFLLAQRSEYFSTFFKEDWNGEGKNVATVKDFSFDVVKLAIDFAHERKVRNQINLNNAEELYRFADFYRMLKLQELAESCLIRMINADNVVQISKIASRLEIATRLYDACLCYLADCRREGRSVSNYSNLDTGFQKLIEQVATLSV